MTLAAAIVEDRRLWNAGVAALPGSHVLQSWEWGEFKAGYGWQPRRLAWRQPDGTFRAAAQVLERRSRRFSPLRMLYCPRGPLLDWADSALRQIVLHDLAGLASESGAIFVRIDPEIPTACPDDPAPPQATIDLQRDLAAEGWTAGRTQVQFRNTFVLDLQADEAELLAAMHPKTRYNLRLAARHGVIIRLGTSGDADLLYPMYAETSLRDRFVIREREYYRSLWEGFQQAERAQLFLAEVDDNPVAGLVLFTFGDMAWYLYGMSTHKHREKMPNHLLQWEAIRWAKRHGLRQYDFWGAPDRLDPSDPMWGVYRFKQGFGARLQCSLGSLDTSRRPGLYWLYHVVAPLALGVMRRRGFSATERSLG
ncbi:MAG: peptidoglycan bridge formation glycyltransferase FemA/FemB family protein [Anaerolineales bacterium]|nr:peptidoglycan bridge formation glycyltransferase FemA/FemB family protein [Anaerolineales bacterium]